MAGWSRIERREVLAREVQSHGRVHGHDVGVRLATQQQRDLSDHLADAERRDHERLPRLVPHDRDLPGRDQVEPLGLFPLRDEAVALLDHARLEGLDERGALGGIDGKQHRGRADEVRHHATPAVRGQLHPHLGASLRNLLERLSAGDEQDRGATGDDARRTWRAREQRHLSEQRAVHEPRERDRRRKLGRVAVRLRPRLLPQLVRIAPDLELAARDDVRLGPFFALCDDEVPLRDGDHLERADQRAEPFLLEVREERERRDERRLGLFERVVGLLRFVDDLRRLRQKRRPGEK